MLLTSFFVGILAFVPSTYGLICGQTDCERDGYQKAYCCGENDEVCCRSSSTNLWWVWLIVVLVIISIGLCVFFLFLHYRRRRRAILYQVQTNTPGVQSHVHVQSNVHQAIPPASSCPPTYGTVYPYQKGYNPNYPTAPGYGYPPPYPAQPAHQVAS